MRKNWFLSSEVQPTVPCSYGLSRVQIFQRVHRWMHLCSSGLVTDILLPHYIISTIILTKKLLGESHGTILRDRTKSIVALDLVYKMTASDKITEKQTRPAKCQAYILPSDQYTLISEQKSLIANPPLQNDYKPRPYNYNTQTILLDHYKPVSFLPF